MELKTIKEFCHKDNLGEGLVFDGSVFKLNIDKELETIATALVDLNENKANKDDLSTLYKIRGSSTVADINVMTPEISWVYNLIDSGTIINGLSGEVPVEAGDNVVYTENGWDKLSAAAKMTLEAGNNISIEGNVINALGYTSTDWGSFATGIRTTAGGAGAHAEGDNTHAPGFAAHAEGGYTIANNSHEHAQGKYNKSNTGETEDTKTIHSIGIGTSEETRKNAKEVMQNGDHYIVGVGGYEGTTIVGAQTLQAVINSKVDKEDNKGLSTEDYTTEEKTKLNSIEEGALVNIQSDWNLSDETLKDYIKNKPDLTVYLLKEEGKSLTSNDYTTEEKEKLSGIETGAQVNTVNSVNGQTGDVVIDQLTAGNNINIENNVITAKGYSTDTTNYTFATGYDTNAIDVYTHAEGFGTKAQGSAAHAEGCKTITTNAYEHALGGYNISNTGENQSDKTLHSIGIGNGEDGRKNAHEVMLNGDTYIIGIGGYTGTNPTEAKTLLEVITEILSKLN